MQATVTEQLSNLVFTIQFFFFKLNEFLARRFNAGQNQIFHRISFCSLHVLVQLSVFLAVEDG